MSHAGNCLVRVDHECGYCTCGADGPSWQEEARDAGWVPRSEALATEKKRPGADADIAENCTYCNGIGACPKCWGRSAIEKLKAQKESLVIAGETMRNTLENAYDWIGTLAREEGPAVDEIETATRAWRGAIRTGEKVVDPHEAAKAESIRALLYCADLFEACAEKQEEWSGPSQALFHAIREWRKLRDEG